MNESYHDNGRDYFENWNGFPDNWELVESEKEIHLDINGNAFIGFIDLIVRDKNTGKYIIVDHKSKSKFKNDEEQAEYARQLYLYSLHIKEAFGEYPTQLIFNMLSEAVKTVVGLGLMNGVGEGKFAPHRETTRAEIAVILYRTLEKLGL